MPKLPFENPLAAVPGGINPAAESGGSAAELNERIQKVIQDVNDIIADAQDAGVYDDRMSIAALKGLAENASAIHERWMEGPEMGMPEEEKDSYNPAKVIERVEGGQGPFGGPVPNPNAIKNPNSLGGRIIEMESPNYGLPPKKKAVIRRLP